jgi:ribosomal-protein-serine acetyltransferase
MFSRNLTESLRISLSIPQFADELFELTDRNRLYLRRWLPWLDGTRTPEDTRQFLTLQIQRFARGESLHVTIFSDGSIAGVAGFNSLDRTNGIGAIGYWLGEEFTGKGGMTTVVRDLIEIGREFYGLQKIDIRCATGNSRSRAIPERLGFSHEGTLRRAERVYDNWLDHEVYALLMDGCGSTPRD